MFGKSGGEPVKTRPIRERKDVQKRHGIRQLPYQDLCYCTWTDEQGNSQIVDLISTDESESIAMLSTLDAQGKRTIWIAPRDQQGDPGTWLWTAGQMEAAERNPIRIDDSENDFEDANNAPIEVLPIHKDRRTELLKLGQLLKKTPEEVQEQLRAEGLDDTLPQNYRTTEELRETEPALEPVRLPVQEKRGFKFSGKKKRR